MRDGLDVGIENDVANEVGQLTVRLKADTTGNLTNFGSVRLQPD